MNVKFAFAILAASLFVTGCATTHDTTQSSTTPAEAPALLTGEEIRSLISGKTVEGKNSDAQNVKAYNSPDGKVSAVSAKGDKTYTSTGTWEIQGNTVCAKWDNKDWKPGCSTVTKNGESYLIKPTASGIPSIPVAKVIDGNPHNL